MTPNGVVEFTDHTRYIQAKQRCPPDFRMTMRPWA
jgi:hypothetical protein